MSVLARNKTLSSYEDRYKTFQEHTLLCILEGNVGAGKTTLLNKAKANLDRIKLKAHDPTLELEIMIEPIGDWTDAQGNNLLEVSVYFYYIYIYIYTNLSYYISS